MSNAILRIEENGFYILYKRLLEKKEVTPKYVIYRHKDFGGDLFQDFYTLTEARRIFKKLTKEAVD